MASLENERSYLNQLQAPNGKKVGPEILEAFLEHEKCVVFGLPGAGKTTLIQSLRMLAQERLNSDGGGYAQPIGYDHFLDQFLQISGMNRKDMKGNERNIFSWEFTRLLLTIQENVRNNNTNPKVRAKLIDSRLNPNFRWLLIADLVGIGELNLGKTTLAHLARQPDFIFVQVIPSPEVLSIAYNTRVAFFLLGRSPRAQKAFNDRLVLEREKLSRPDLSPEQLREELTQKAMDILRNNNIVTDIQDPVEIAEIIANMGGPGWINALRNETKQEAQQWRDEGRLRLPKPFNEQTMYIRHGNYYRNEVLHLPPERTYVVVNRLQPGKQIPWNLGRLYDDRMAEAMPILYKKHEKEPEIAPEVTNP